MVKQRSAVSMAKETFLKYYREGAFPIGSKIPSEQEMAKKLNVSRETWRRALELLRSEGVLISKHGSGTYLLDRPHKISNDLAQLQSLTTMIQSSGIVESESDNSCMIRTASPEICIFFDSEPEEPFFVLRKIRYSRKDRKSVV